MSSVSIASGSPAAIAKRSKAAKKAKKNDRVNALMLSELLPERAPVNPEIEPSVFTGNENKRISLFIAHLFAYKGLVGFPFDPAYLAEYWRRYDAGTANGDEFIIAANIIAKVRGCDVQQGLHTVLAVYLDNLDFFTANAENLRDKCF